MSSPSILSIREAILEGNFDRSQDLLNTRLQQDDLTDLDHWYQGLAYLLQGQEEEAQGIWFTALMEIPETEVEAATIELCQVLEDAALAKVFSKNYQDAWLIRQYLEEISPNYFNNLFALLELDDRLGLEDSLETHGQEILSNLESGESLNGQPLYLAYSLVIFEAYEPLRNLLSGESYLDYLVNFVDQNPSEMDTLKQALCEFIDRSLGNNDRCLEIAHRLELLSDKDFKSLSFLITFYHKKQQYDKAIDLSEQFVTAAELLEDRVAGYYFLIQSLLKAGAYFDRVLGIHQVYLDYIKTLLKETPIKDYNLSQNLIILPSFLGYLQDNPIENNQWKKTIADCYVQMVQQEFLPILSSLPREISLETSALPETIATVSKEPEDPEVIQNSIQLPRKLRIGYISECLRRHSIGYLVRDLFQYHDRSKFEIFAYTFQHTEDLIQKEILSHKQDLKIIENTDPAFIYNLIQRDGVDILIDLDSLTSKNICRVLALKPAPIQVSWLGYDTAELPTMDYVLADPYLLPEQAQSYYREKIWRLPRTYVATNGFEVGVPTLRREMLDIPRDAIVYFSAQTGYKRNPANIRSQLEILKAVPNSYFLIKGFYCDLNALQSFFQDLVDQVGVEYDRLRFLDTVKSEETHRANLNLADIVLDTYPYTGATTTLESLWLGIPVVTLVGQQFSARSSYTALMNLGITIGLAWTVEEYVEWGICLGKDDRLRRQVSLQLQDRQTKSSLWQAKTFTQDLEFACQSMFAAQNLVD